MIEGLLPAFEQEMAASGHPVVVDLESLDLADDAFRAEIARRYAAGTAPDVTSYPTNWIPDFGAQGDLADLTADVEAWPDWSQHYYRILRERAVGGDGQIRAIPRGATVIQLFYRRDVLQARRHRDGPAHLVAGPGRPDDQLRDLMDRPPILIPAGTTWGGGTFDEGFINLMLGTTSPLYDRRSIAGSSGARG